MAEIIDMLSRHVFPSARNAIALAQSRGKGELERRIATVDDIVITSRAMAHAAEQAHEALQGKSEYDESPLFWLRITKAALDRTLELMDA